MTMLFGKRDWMKSVFRWSRTGSRIICTPPHLDTDEDFIALEKKDTGEMLRGFGFKQDGNPQFYTGNDNGSFRSFRRGVENVITTPSMVFYEKFCAATAFAKRLNIQRKSDRIALFQLVLYDVSIDDMEHQEPCVLLDGPPE
jgi:hypothetical protein